MTLGIINQEANTSEIAAQQSNLLMLLSKKTAAIMQNCGEPHSAAHLSNLHSNLLLAAGYCKAISDGTLSKGDPRISAELTGAKARLASLHNLSLEEDETIKNAATKALYELVAKFKEVGLDSHSPENPVSFTAIIDEMIFSTAACGLDCPTKTLGKMTDRYQQSSIGFRQR